MYLYTVKILLQCVYMSNEAIVGTIVGATD